MDQPTIGGSAWAAPAEAGKRVEGCPDIKQGFFDSSKKPEISEQETKQVLIDSSEKRELSEREIKQLLYESSRKTEISEQELQDIFAKMEGADPNKKLTKSEARSTRELLDVWKVKGELFVLTFEEFLEKVFLSDEEFEQKCKEVMEAKAAKELKLKDAKELRKLKIAEKNQTSKPDEEDEKPQCCEVCMKVDDHMSFQCPYLDDIPNPEKALVGQGYEICCHHCLKSDHGHLDGRWKGFSCETSLNWAKMMMPHDEDEEDSNSDEEDSDSDEEESYSNEEESESDDEP